MISGCKERTEAIAARFLSETQFLTVSREKVKFNADNPTCLVATGRFPSELSAPEVALTA